MDPLQEISNITLIFLYLLPGSFKNDQDLCLITPDRVSWSFTHFQSSARVATSRSCSKWGVTETGCCKSVDLGTWHPKPTVSWHRHPCSLLIAIWPRQPWWLQSWRHIGGCEGPFDGVIYSCMARMSPFCSFCNSMHEIFVLRSCLIAFHKLMKLKLLNPSSPYFFSHAGEKIRLGDDTQDNIIHIQLNFPYWRANHTNDVLWKYPFYLTSLQLTALLIINSGSQLQSCSWQFRLAIKLWMWARQVLCWNWSFMLVQTGSQLVWLA